MTAFDNISPSSDEELLRFLKEGNAEESNIALEQIYVKNFDLVKALVFKNGGSETEAADIFQDAIIILYNKVKQTDFKLTSALSTYIYGVSRNLWLNYSKKSGRTVSLEDAIKYKETDALDQSHMLIQTERSTLIAKLIEQLGEDCKEIIRLFYFEKSSMKQIMEKMNTSSIPVTKNKKMNCIKKLRKNIMNSNFYKDILKS